MNLLFFINSILFGIALAMDAFSVSVANGLNEPNMSRKKSLLISILFGAFQFAMPMIGWLCVHFFLESFNAFQKYIPWIALILLLIIGIKMIYDSLHNKEDEKPALNIGELLIQAVATSIDALSVGFTIAQYDFFKAFVESFIIGIMTTIICIIGVIVGKKFGNKYSRSASIVGGIILLLIGIEIFVQGIL